MTDIDEPFAPLGDGGSDPLAIPPTPRTSAIDDVRLLHEQRARMRHRRSTFLGYPVSLDLDYRHFGGLLDMLWNTVGNPEQPDPTRIDRQPFERHVVRFLAGLAGANPDLTFGYVTAGGTESNLFGAFLGRERLPDAPLYYSAAAHHRIGTIARMLCMEPVPVPCLRDDSLDLRALRQACESRRGRGAVVIATVGTTMLGGIDNLPGIRTAVQAGGRSHLHVDAALGGLVAAFSPNPPPWGFDAGADSMTISGHKLIGTPTPCGVVLARRDIVPPGVPGTYLGTDDDTLACSRNALNPIFLWYRLRRLGLDGLGALVHRCLDNAEYAHRRLAAMGRRPWRHPCSITVVFDRPPQSICRRWHLATTAGIAHLVAMPHVTRDTIDAFCRDLR